MRKIMHNAPTLRLLLCLCVDRTSVPAHTARRNGGRRAQADHIGKVAVTLDGEQVTALLSRRLQRGGDKSSLITAWAAVRRRHARPVHAVGTEGDTGA